MATQTERESMKRVQRLRFAGVAVDQYIALLAQAREEYDAALRAATPDERALVAEWEADTAREIARRTTA